MASHLTDAELRALLLDSRELGACRDSERSLADDLRRLHLQAVEDLGTMRARCLELDDDARERVVELEQVVAKQATQLRCARAQRTVLGAVVAGVVAGGVVAMAL